MKNIPEMRWTGAHVATFDEIREAGSDGDGKALRRADAGAMEEGAHGAPEGGADGGHLGKDAEDHPERAVSMRQEAFDGRGEILRMLLGEFGRIDMPRTRKAAEMPVSMLNSVPAWD